MSGSLSPQLRIGIEFAGARNQGNAYTLALNASAPRLDHSWNAAAAHDLPLFALTLDHAQAFNATLLGQPLQAQPYGNQMDGWGVAGWTIVGVVTVAVIGGAYMFDHMFGKQDEVHTGEGSSETREGCNGIQVATSCVLSTGSP